MIASVIGAALLFSGSAVAAKDLVKPLTDQSALSRYAQAPMPFGAYVPAPKKAEPRGVVKPFTWKEKRWFDNSDGELG
jgi:hypothetical protein